MCWAFHVIALSWVQKSVTDDKSTLIHVMAWCRQAANYYLGQWWPNAVTAYDVTRPQRVRYNVGKWPNNVNIIWHGLAFLIQIMMIVWYVYYLTYSPEFDVWFRWSCKLTFILYNQSWSCHLVIFHWNIFGFYLKNIPQITPYICYWMGYVPTTIAGANIMVPCRVTMSLQSSEDRALVDQIYGCPILRVSDLKITCSVFALK